MSEVVLLPAGAAQPFRRAKTASGVLQFVAKHDCHLAIRGLHVVGEHSASPSQFDARSKRTSNGLSSIVVLKCTVTVGSRCSIRTKPLCTTGATTGLSAEAATFSVHSPVKSGCRN